MDGFEWEGKTCVSYATGDQDGNRRVPHGPDSGSPAWCELFRHALAEAARLDLEMGFNIQSGWNLGGPTVTAEEASKRVTRSVVSVAGAAPVPPPLPHLDQKACYSYPGEYTAPPAWHLLDPGPASPTNAAFPLDGVIDLTARMTADGRLRWEAPPGRFEILRLGFTVRTRLRSCAPSATTRPGACPAATMM